MKTLDISHEFINHSIEVALRSFREGKFVRYGNSDLTNVYFIGATLCLDIQDKFGDTDVITVNHSSETFGLFSGGVRRLLPIKALKTLELLMKEQGINHKTKWLC